MRRSVLFVAVAILAAAVLAAALAGAVWLAQPSYKVMPRHEFVNTWSLASAEDVVSVYGAPAVRYQRGVGQEAWVYYGLTYDPLTRQRDAEVEVIIWGGQTVGEIRFP